MSISPDESGEITPARIFGGQLCVRVPTQDVCEGDFIELYKRGYRVRRVRRIIKTRKTVYVQVEQVRANPFKQQQLDIKDLYAVWRSNTNVKG